ncbi:hypothetical protein NDU88_004560 [Pleurodeles waltl]|uniref:Uncharacterized protein n=1 Tax=Pleurodeles waltl TaxID=8319 RepID=A0AAV7WW90_PLEWA|nr:hypothetical protein NDU88_004560 [Pleurodeles waltl]
MPGKRCSRSRANSISGCPDNRRAGVGDANPDFRVRKGMKSNDGSGTRREEENANGGIAETEGEIKTEPTESCETDAEEIERGRDLGNGEIQEPTKEATESSHVPGGTWLSKDGPISVLGRSVLLLAAPSLLELVV